jgi:hypothetical protein
MNDAIWIKISTTELCNVKMRIIRDNMKLNKINR